MHHSIEIECLSFSYPDGHQALRDVSLAIQPCEKVALVGPNGAGKSTFILHLNGILSGNGSVRVCGLEVAKENLGRLRAMVGLVFQSPDDRLFFREFMTMSLMDLYTKVYRCRPSKKESRSLSP